MMLLPRAVATFSRVVILTLSLPKGRNMLLRPGVRGPRSEVRGLRPVVLLPREQSAFSQYFFAELALQPVAQQETRIGCVADTKLHNHLVGQASACEVFAGAGAFRTPQAFLEECDSAFVDI